MLTKQDLLEQREQMQEDARCILDGIEDLFMDNLCQMIVDRMNILINQLDRRIT